MLHQLAQLAPLLRPLVVVALWLIADLPADRPRSPSAPR